ncbi:phosphoadenosine phosphosulfate reductase, partial [Archaeoglobales archaeon]
MEIKKYKMYGVKWDKKTRGIKLITSGDGDISPLIRPVFHEELDLLGFNRYWKYPKSKEPLLWSVGRYYFYDGVKVARVKGGGFYENPQLEVFEDNLELEPVDIEKMIRKNREIMENVVHTTLDFISEIYSEYINRVDKVVVAFSGGKDSAVLLDLVQRVLAPDEYIVMFNDTTMELSPTYKFVEIIKQRYPNLNFYTARYKKPAIEMWREVGIPSRVHRWCCTIYKTVPTIKTIQKLVNKETPRVLLYDGIRADESPSRAKLSQISRGKHLQQINVHPIIDWNSAIVYLYTFMRDLPLNELYRYGTVRVGCAVCPFGSNWKEAILWLKFNEEIKPYLNLIEKYAKFRCRGEGLEDFIREGAWKKRIGGANLGVSDKITILEENNQTKIIIHHPNIKNWFEWFKAVGDVTVINPSGYVVFDKAYYGFSFYSDSRELKIVFDSALPKDLIYYLKNAAYKVAYCIKCGTCEVECPNSAIEIRTDKIKIDEEKCTKCHKCLSFVDRGCIVADSFRISLVVDKMSKNTSLSRYKFGIRKEWLEEFFSDPEKWWVENSLGPVQFEAMKLWLIDAEI